MPFIWNNIDYLLVDEQQEYDKNCFVVVRKLFVTLKTSSNEVNDSSTL